jgi:hypothetical protein
MGPARVIAKLLPVGVGLGFFILAGCSTVESVTSPPGASPPGTSPPGVLPPVTLPPGPPEDGQGEEEPVKVLPGVPLEEPDTVAPADTVATADTGVPDPDVAANLAVWMGYRPLMVRLSDRGRDGDRQIRAEYMTELVRLLPNEIGSVPDRSSDRWPDQVREAAMVTEFLPELRITPSSRHFYAATDIRVTVYLQGFGDQSVSAVVKGATLLSSLSHRDAGLNSLRLIDPDILERAVMELQHELVEKTVQEGLAYRIEYTEKEKTEIQHRVLRSLGSPGDGEKTWYIPFSPETVQDRMVVLLDGSNLDFLLDGPTRIGRFVTKGIGR